MSLRVDKWLWAVRIYKSRAASNDACSSGRVQVNGAVAKPATKIVVGDMVNVRRRDELLIAKVVQPLDKRVSAALAAKAYEDLSPPPAEQPHDPLGEVLAVAARRERGAGRPTKKERRDMNKMRDNS